MQLEMARHVSDARSTTENNALATPMSPALSGPHKNAAQIIAEMPTDSSSSSHARNLVSSPKTAGVLALPNLRAANQ
jgi:hypothetical protein